jgi:hypothetical protein
LVAGISKTLRSEIFRKVRYVPNGSLTGNAEFNKQVVLVTDRLDIIISATDDKLYLLGSYSFKTNKLQASAAYDSESNQMQLGFTPLQVKMGDKFSNSLKTVCV